MSTSDEVKAIGTLQRPHTLLLRELVERKLNGTSLVTSRDIARRTPLTPSQAGYLLGELEDSRGWVRVDKHSTAGKAGTWKVTIGGE